MSSTRLLASTILRRAWTLLPTTIIFGIGGIGVSLTQAIALRLMDSNEVGKIVLVYGLMSVGSTLAGCGIPQLLARTASADSSQMAWRRSARLTTIKYAVLPSVLIATIGLAAFPGLRGWGLIAVPLLTLLLLTANLQILESSFLRASGRFTMGAAVMQGSLALVAMVLAVPLGLSVRVSALQVIWIMLGIQILLVTTGASIGRRPPAGTVKEFTGWLRGRVALLAGFWLSSSVAVSFRWADRLVLASILSLAELSQYQSIFLLTSLYDLLGVAIGYISLPRYAKAGSWSTRALWVTLALGVAVTGATLIVGLVLGPKIFLFTWTDEKLATFGVLMGVGILKLAYAEVSAIMGALAPGTQVLNYGVLGGVSLVVGLAVIVAAGLTWGMLGAAVGSLVLWAVRVWASYAYMSNRLARSHSAAARNTG